MTAEVIIAGAAVVGVFGSYVALIITWRKNGRNQATRDISHAEAQAARDATLEGNQKAIIQRLDDKQHGLGAVNDKISGLKTHLAVVDERLTGHDREIKELKGKK
jgi:uncharacterized membrane protein